MAGKASRLRRKLVRKAAKQATKARHAAEYATRRANGTNSKRQKLHAKRNKANTIKHLHLTYYCGNVGCKECFPRKSRFEQMGIAQKEHH